MSDDVKLVDKDLYIEWLNSKVPQIEQWVEMTKSEDSELKKKGFESIENRIIELQNIVLYAREEFKLVAEARDRVTGRTGSLALHKNRVDLIKEPNIKVNFEGDPRKRIKKSKEQKEDDQILALTGIDLASLKRDARAVKQGLKPNNPTVKAVGDKIVPIDQFADIKEKQPDTPDAIQSAKAKFSGWKKS